MRPRATATPTRSANAQRLLASLPEPPDRNADHHDKSARKRNGEIGNREDAVAAAMIRAEQARYVVRDTPGPAAADLARPARPDAWPAPNLRQRRTGFRRRRAGCVRGRAESRGEPGPLQRHCRRAVRRARLDPAEHARAAQREAGRALRRGGRGLVGPNERVLAGPVVGDFDLAADHIDAAVVAAHAEAELAAVDRGGERWRVDLDMPAVALLRLEPDRACLRDDRGQPFVLVPGNADDRVGRDEDGLDA